MSTYLYGIIGTDHPARIAGLRGVGEPPTELRVLHSGELAAVVGDAPDGLRAKRRDLLAHQEVLQEMCAQGATLPMRFGVIAEDDGAARNGLAVGQEHHLRMLAELDGRVEFNVKLAHHEERALERVLLADSELRRYNDELRAGNGGQDERARFGEQVSAALSELERMDTATLLPLLDRHTVRRSEGPAVAGSFANISFLVERDRTADFESTVREVRDAIGDAAEIRCHGPLPPYSFAETVTAN